MKNAIAVLLVALVIAALFLVPLAIVWSINTIVVGLFATATPLPYSFWSWLAIVVLNITWAYKPSIQKVKMVSEKGE